ncbi:hypothetical protein HKD37_04G009017 [Glycine soja]
MNPKLCLFGPTIGSFLFIKLKDQAGRPRHALIDYGKRKGKEDVLSLSLNWHWNSTLLFLCRRTSSFRKMLENLQAPPSTTESAPVVKRYAPPNQRNRSANRRKSSDRLDRTNSVGNDLEKNQVASSRSVHIPDHEDAGSSNLLNENHYSRFIALEGCSCSAAAQLLNDRWTAAIQSYNNPKDSSEKPVMYSSGTSVWTAATSASSSVSQRDFLGELRRQMHSANPSFTT